MSVRDPSTIPNVEFTIETADISAGGGPNHAIWGYCRARDDEAMWVMPDFGFWAYPHDTVGSYDEFREKVRQSEEPSFHDKLPQLVWRGHTKLDDHAHLAAVRNRLLAASKGHDWNNVDGFNDDRADGNRIDMHDHCRYQFAAHTEG